MCNEILLFDFAQLSIIKDTDWVLDNYLSFSIYEPYFSNHTRNLKNYHVL